MDSEREQDPDVDTTSLTNLRENITQLEKGEYTKSQLLEAIGLAKVGGEDPMPVKDDSTSTPEEKISAKTQKKKEYRVHQIEEARKEVKCPLLRDAIDEKFTR